MRIKNARCLLDGRSLRVFFYRGFFFALLIALVAPYPLGAQDDKVTVLRVGLLIDGSGGTPMQDAAIVIKGKRIASVGKYVETTLPAGAKIIDLKDKIALPGLVDSHAHYKDWQAEVYLNNGVTTAFDIGAPLNVAWSLMQREAVEKRKILGPRLVVAPRFNAPRAGGLFPLGFADVLVENVDQAREQVRKAIGEGADCIKALEQLSVEILRAIVEETHRAGRCVIAHELNGTEAVLAGIEIDSIEHNHAVGKATVRSEEGKKKLREDLAKFPWRVSNHEMNSLMEEESYETVIKAMIGKNTHWSPTLASAWRYFSPQRERFFNEEMKLYALPGLRYVPRYFRDNTKKYFDDTVDAEPQRLERARLGYRKIMDLVGRFAKAGGKLQAGSDPNTIVPGYGMHTEMELLVEAGATPMQAIQAATINPAKMVRREQDFGTIALGRFADILIVDANPLEKISNTRRITMVFKDGRPIDLKYHANYRAPIPRPIPDRSAPRIDAVSPAVVAQGDVPVTLTIRGAWFLGTAVVKLNGKRLPTEVKFPGPNRSRFLLNFITSQEITATVSPNQIQKPGTYPLVVEHPDAGGAVSNTAYLMVKFR